MNYPVNEFFETIQGEAHFTGTPAIFIRLQGCPVGCGWCDTKHTWDIEPQDRTIIGEILIKNEDNPRYAMMSELDIYVAIKRFKPRHIVITGGEPCLYDLRPLTEYLILNGYTVQIETSGTHEILCHESCWVTVSPKIDMAGGFKMNYIALKRADEIKHPIGKEKDIDNLLKLIEDNSINLDFVDIWLQPLSQSGKATDICVDNAIKHNFKVSIQTHKYMGVR